jgi:Flp pilus assembly protein TadB
MLTPAQAEIIADGLVEAKKLERSHSALPRPIPIVYRSSALRKLAPSRQAELLEQASTSVNSKRSVLLACCGSTLLCVAPLWLLGSYLGGWLSMVVLLSFAPAFVWHAHLVRRELGALLARSQCGEIGGPEV